jgi:hypothetical protein
VTGVVTRARRDVRADDEHPAAVEQHATAWSRHSGTVNHLRTGAAGRYIGLGPTYPPAVDYLVSMRRSGPAYDHERPAEQQSGWTEHAAFMEALVDDGFVLLGGPLADQRRVVLAVRAQSQDDVLRRLGDDPWSGTHLVAERVEEWTLRLNGCNG